MPTRKLEHPNYEIEDHEDGVLVRFLAPGSKLGPIEIVFDTEEAGALLNDLDMAVSFAEAQSV